MANVETTDSELRVPGSLVIAGWTLHVNAHRIQQGDRTIRLEPKATRLLAYLASHAGTPVSREALLDAVWPGVVVGDEALTNAINKLRRAFGDDRQNPRIIETIPKMGYRLIASVEIRDEPGGRQADAGVAANNGAIPPDSDGTSGQPGNTTSAPVSRRVYWLTGALVLVALAGLGIHLFSRSLHEAPIPPGMQAEQPAITLSLAVLPFDNLGGPPDTDYFADGMTDDLITSLAKFPNLLVIARDSTFIYKNRPLDIGRIADRLNVSYILHGSVRRADQQVRINAQLIETSNGSLVWGETYDGRINNIFELQDEITGSIVKALAPHLTPRDLMDLELSRTGNAQAYNNLLIGRQHFYMFYNKEENLKAREFFDTAVDLDPEFALAYAMQAWTHAFDAMNGWSEDREASLLRARELATRAIALQEALPVAYFVRGLAHRELGEYVKALVEAEKAIEYDPNYAHAYMLLATLLYYAGRPEEGLLRIKKAMRINPHHPYNYTFHLGQAYYILGRYAEAVETFQQGVASNPASERLHVWLAASYVKLGDFEQARWETDQVMTLNPEFSLERVKETYPSPHPAEQNSFVETLLKAGLQHRSSR